MVVSGGWWWWWLRPILVFSLSLDQAEQNYISNNSDNSTFSVSLESVLSCWFSLKMNLQLLSKLTKVRDLVMIGNCDCHFNHTDSKYTGNDIHWSSLLLCWQCLWQVGLSQECSSSLKFVIIDVVSESNGSVLDIEKSVMHTMEGNYVMIWFKDTTPCKCGGWVPHPVMWFWSRASHPSW